MLRRFYAEWNTQERYVQELLSKGKQFPKRYQCNDSGEHRSVSEK